MNIKQKFNSIDQSKLDSKQVEILKNIEQKTDGFKTKDKEIISKIDMALDKIISALKEKNPEAIKSKTTSRTKTQKSSGSGKRTLFSIAKDIRKSDETWEEAKNRAKKIMEDENKQTTQKMKSETEKLLAFIKRKKELDGLSGTSVKKDSKIEALPKGRRVSKKGWKNQYGESEGGRVYYENRDNRTDRLAPSFADKVYLAEGGYANKGVYVETLDEEIDLSDDAKVRARKTQQGSNKSYSELREKHGGSPEALAFANGGYVVIAKSEKGGGFVMSKPTTKAKAEKLKSLLPKIDGESNEVMTLNKASKLSGLVGKEYLKYADGGAIIGTPETPLARGLDIDYTGLVGETGGMSAGEMFANGGGIPNNYQDRYYADIWDIDWTQEQKNHFLQDHKNEIGFDEEFYGVSIKEKTTKKIKSSKGQEVGFAYIDVDKLLKTKSSELPKYVKLSLQKHIREGQYAYGGRTRERKYLNHSEKHEVRYSKDKPHRRGYGYASGGGVGKKKTQKELRQEYLEKLGSKEADVWDKIGAESGSQIRNSDKMLKAYAEGVEEMLQEEGVGKGSFDQEDYDFYTDENWHLFNEFLVWNGYYEPEMTKTEKAWREDRFKDPEYKKYVSNPSVISVSGSSKSKSKSSKYIVKSDIKEVKVKTDAGYEYTFKGSDVLNGVNILEKGSLLKNNATYVAKRNIMYVELKNGERIKPANGYWIKKDAKGELFKPEKKEEYKVMSNQAIFPKRGVGTYWYVENSKGQTINNTTGKPYKGKEMTNYYFLNEDGAKKFAEKLNSSTFEGGGYLKNGYFKNEIDNDYIEEINKYYNKWNSIKDEKDSENFKKTKPPMFGTYKTTDILEQIKHFEKLDIPFQANEVSRNQFKKEVSKIIDNFMNKKSYKGGGSTKRGGAMQLAKQIRKDGESWQSALKRANEQMRNK